MRRLAVVGAILLVGSVSQAAVTVTATIDPAKVSVGQSADLSVVIDGTQSAPTPQIANTAGLTVTYAGPASQMTFVNGRISSSITHHFTVVGTKPGRYAIGPITVDADGKRYDAGTVSLELLAGGSAGADAAPSGDQLTLDGRMQVGEMEVDESLLTGESDRIPKRPVSTNWAWAGRTALARAKAPTRSPAGWK